MKRKTLVENKMSRYIIHLIKDERIGGAGNFRKTEQAFPFTEEEAAPRGNRGRRCTRDGPMEVENEVQERRTEKRTPHQGLVGKTLSVKPPHEHTYQFCLFGH